MTFEQILAMSETEYRVYLMGRTLGGTAAGAILGLSRFTTPAQLFDKVLGLYEEPDNPHMERGRMLEPIVFQLMQRRPEVRSLIPYGQTSMPHPTIPFIHGTPDADITVEDRGEGILEVKCPRSSVVARYLSAGIEPSYLVQVQLYMAVCRRPWALFAVLNADAWELHTFYVERDDVMIAAIEGAMMAFWNEHILTRTRPQVGRTISRIPPAAAVGTATTRPPLRLDDRATRIALEQLKAAREQAELANHSQKLAEERVKAIMGEATELEVLGIGRVSWKETTRRSLTKERFVELRPLDRERFLAWALEHVTAGDVTTAQAYADELRVSIEDFESVTASRTFRPTFE